jgi:hypothetical protein
MQRLKVASATAAMLLLLVAAPAVAYSPGELPNLVALATEDLNVVVTYEGLRTPVNMAHAGAFATDMRQYGLIGIPSYTPDVSQTYLVCWVNTGPTELIAIYGAMNLTGIYEAGYLCGVLMRSGAQVELNPSVTPYLLS